MKYKLPAAVLLSIFFCMGMPLSSAGAQQSAKAYTIPDNLKPMSTWSGGWSAEETIKYRREFGDNTLTEEADDGAYAITHLSEVLPTAIVHRNGQIAILENASIPEIENVMATTALGTMTLRQMIDDPRARIRAIAVVHKGKLVYENYIGIRPGVTPHRAEPPGRRNPNGCGCTSSRPPRAGSDRSGSRQEQDSGTAPPPSHRWWQRIVAEARPVGPSGARSEPRACG